jgi:hypothetical protein
MTLKHRSTCIKMLRANELRQAMAVSQAGLAELGGQLQEGGGESEESEARVGELGDEGDRYGCDAGESDEEADIADRQAEEAEGEAGRIAQELELLCQGGDQDFGASGGFGGAGGSGSSNVN